MKQNKIWNGICAVLWGLQLAVEGMTFFTISRLNMLPEQYMMLLGGGLLILWVLMGLLLIPGKNNTGSVRRIVAAFLILVICIGCSVLVTVVSDVYETMQGVLGSQPGTEDIKPKRGVYVLDTDQAHSIGDAKNYVFALVENFDTANVQQVLNAIGSVNGKSPVTKAYGSLTAMVDGLYTKEVNAIIVSEANLMVLEADDDYADIRDRVRLLYEVEIVEQLPPPTTQPTNPDETEPPTEAPTVPDMTAPSIQEPEGITNTPFLVYIAGSDTRSHYLYSSRNDVNILAVVNPVTKQVLLINTPRDYFVKNPAGNDIRDKLTHCGIYGVENSALALGNLYGDRVDYYAQINFDGFKTFIDAIGGVTVYSDVSFKAGQTYISKGENQLNGEQALAFARERYNLSGGDVSRGENQMKVIRAVIQKMTSGTTVITRYAEILDSLKGMFSTNITMDEISQLVKMQLGDMESWDILTYSVGGYGDMEITYSDPGRELYVMWPDNEDVAKATELIDRVIAGEVLTKDDLK